MLCAMKADKTHAAPVIRANGDPVLDWLRRMPPDVEERESGDPAVPLDCRTPVLTPARPVSPQPDKQAPLKATDWPDCVRVEIRHHRHTEHPTWEIPTIPEDLFPLRAAGLLGQSLQHRPICAIVDGLASGEAARIHSDHSVGPFCHAMDDRCAALVEWRMEREGPDEWTVLVTRR